MPQFYGAGRAPPAFAAGPVPSVALLPQLAILPAPPQSHRPEMLRRLWKLLRTDFFLVVRTLWYRDWPVFLLQADSAPWKIPYPG